MPNATLQSGLRTHAVVCVNLIHDGRNLQFTTDLEWKFYLESFNYPQSFCQKLLRESRQKKYFFFVMFNWSNPKSVLT